MELVSSDAHVLNPAARAAAVDPVTAEPDFAFVSQSGESTRDREYRNTEYIQRPLKRACLEGDRNGYDKPLTITLDA